MSHRRIPVTVEHRTYEIVPGTMDAWLTLFHDKIVPLHEEFGLPVRGAWADRATSTFLWVREFVGEGTAEEQEARYRASERRAAVIGDEPKAFVLSISVRRVETVFPVGQ
jgi:hypothetical protein